MASTISPKILLRWRPTILHSLKCLPGYLSEVLQSRGALSHVDLQNGAAQGVMQAAKDLLLVVCKIQILSSCPRPSTTSSITTQRIRTPKSHREYKKNMGYRLRLIKSKLF